MMQAQPFTFSILFVTLLALLPTSVNAQQSSDKISEFDPVDQVVAAGIALKTEFIFSRIAAGKEEKSTTYFKNSIETVLNDSKAFSNSESGEQMRKSTEELVRRLLMLLTGDPTKNQELIRFLSNNGIDPNNATPDPKKIAMLITNELKSYVVECQLPADLIDFDKYDEPRPKPKLPKF